jgi:hypothetical protein
LPDLVRVTNRFFGASVTCSGLVVGADIIAALRSAPGAPRTTFIPPNCLNYDGVTIDEMTPADLGAAVGAPVVAPAESFVAALCEHGDGEAARA